MKEGPPEEIIEPEPKTVLDVAQEFFPAATISEVVETVAKETQETIDDVAPIEDDTLGKPKQNEAVN